LRANSFRKSLLPPIHRKIPNERPAFFMKTFEFGGPLLGKSHAKIHRPISSSGPMHFVFHSQMAVGNASFMIKRNRKIVERVLKKHKKAIRLINLRIESRFIHLVFHSLSREGTIRFLRVFSGLVARSILSAEKSKSKLKKIRFWSFRPYSRRIRLAPRSFLEEFIAETQMLFEIEVKNSS